jgi:hypothetical protein
MGEFFDFLFACILIYYVLRAILRFFVPVLFEKAVNRAQQQQQQYHQSGGQQQQYYNQNTNTSDKIKVDYVPPQPKRKASIPDSEGDFIDYDEIK